MSQSVHIDPWSPHGTGEGPNTLHESSPPIWAVPPGLVLPERGRGRRPGRRVVIESPRPSRSRSGSGGYPHEERFNPPNADGSSDTPKDFDSIIWGDVCSSPLMPCGQLWLLSLITALISASAAILLKQTFREYKTWGNVPRTLEALRLRQLRFRALQRWHVSEVVAALPTMLEAAVLLFMAGLPIFIWNLHITLTVVVASVVGCFLVATLAVTVLPAITRNFPYRSPAAWGLWKANMAIRAAFQGHIVSENTRLPTQRDTVGTKGAASTQNAEPATVALSWQERDLRFSRSRELDYLWDLLRWFCSSWSDHRLAPAVRGCMSDLIYGSNALSTPYHNYIDVVEGALPQAFNMPPMELYSALLQIGNLSTTFAMTQFPRLVINHSHVKAFNEKLAETPWKMIALLFDEVVAGLRIAVRDDFKSSMYEHDHDRSLAIISLCFLGSLVKRAKKEQLQAASDESRIALACDIFCHVEASLLPSLPNIAATVQPFPFAFTTEISSLEDIALAWLSAPDTHNLIIGKDNCLRMLFAAASRRAAILDAGGEPKMRDLRMFGTLSSVALKVASSNDYFDDTSVLAACSRVMSSIESIIEISIEKAIMNSGMGSAEFPWATVLAEHADSLSSSCKADLTTGLSNGLFTFRDPAEKVLLLEALVQSSQDTKFPVMSRGTTLQPRSRRGSHSASRPCWVPFLPGSVPGCIPSHPPPPNVFVPEVSPSLPPSLGSRGSNGPSPTNLLTKQTASEGIVEYPPSIAAPLQSDMKTEPLLTQNPTVSDADHAGSMIVATTPTMDEPLARGAQDELQHPSGISSAIQLEHNHLITTASPAPSNVLEGICFSRNVNSHLMALSFASEHSVMYDNQVWPTAAHLLESMKYTPTKSGRELTPNDRVTLPGLRERVRQCRTVEEVSQFVAGASYWIRSDWAEVAPDRADEVLRCKIRQHWELQVLLVETEDQELLYVDPEDCFWGAADAGGRNELGKALKRARQWLLGEQPPNAKTLYVVRPAQP